jgi:hypothetical protein
MLLAGIEPTLDHWLDMNNSLGVYDAELLEIMPVQFRQEYEDRLRFNTELEEKFERQQREAESDIERDRR